MRVVISQPMFLPWIGLFEQIRMADLYIHYDDVQFPLGRSFMSRVQIKTPSGRDWLSAPVKRAGTQMINQVVFDSGNWREEHLKKLQHNYARAEHWPDILPLVEQIYGYDTTSISEFNINALEQISSYLGFQTKFARSSETPVEGKSSERLIALLEHYDADTYLTGHGAAGYLNHELFEERNIKVEYIDYKIEPYRQLHGDFNQYVSFLDTLASLEKAAMSAGKSQAIPWREFLAGSH